MPSTGYDISGCVMYDIYVIQMLYVLAHCMSCPLSSANYHTYMLLQQTLGQCIFKGTYCQCNYILHSITAHQRITAAVV